tara:strand:- start:1304 stop:1573 length:270 start_codon:yes stop_codon:yes gene_type:complete
MPHILRFKNEGTNENGNQCSDEAQVIYDRYVDEGKILERDILSSLGGEYTKISFATEADCVAFRQEMSDINERDTSGTNRSGVTTYDED